MSTSAHSPSPEPRSSQPATRLLTLRDGRKLAYEETGDPNGSPVFFFHGWCSSRLLRHPDDAATAALGVRLVTVDRPGAGLSDFQPKRTLLDWPTDVAALADALRWDSFAIVAHSGAGPHALACAHLLGKRVRQVSLVSGFSPIDRPGATDGMADQMRKGIWLLRRLPFLASLMLRPLPARYREDARAAFNAQFGQGLPEADVAALAEPALASAVHTAAAEAFRQGSAGAALEMLLFLSRPWGFEPEDVRSRVRLWYGTADTVVPIGMGRALANALPNSELTELPNAGHMAFLEHWEAILREAAAA